jgi:hypothetical protein
VASTTMAQVRKKSITEPRSSSLTMISRKVIRCQG